MELLRYPSALLIIILLQILSSNGYAQNVDESALALKKRGEAFRKAYGISTLDEQVEVVFASLSSFTDSIPFLPISMNAS